MRWRILLSDACSTPTCRTEDGEFGELRRRDLGLWRDSKYGEPPASSLVTNLVLHVNNLKECDAEQVVVG
uniref:Uncharacterized protein n=1 Tax=Helianthus annuus TaxID=4232 RepID=A0A251UNV0_HELAN